jgi:ABC-type glutathione transport system ATPase component
VVLEVKRLAKSFWLKQGLFGKREFKAVQNVNFQLRKGHTLGVVGESGSGKTTMGLTLLRLHEPTAARSSSTAEPAEAERPRRQAMRRRIQVVFQNPYASLNPRFTIGQTLVEPMPSTASAPTTGRALSARHAPCWKRWAWTSGLRPSTRTSSAAASASASPSRAA